MAITDWMDLHTKALSSSKDILNGITAVLQWEENVRKSRREKGEVNEVGFSSYELALLSSDLNTVLEELIPVGYGTEDAEAGVDDDNEDERLEDEVKDKDVDNDSDEDEDNDTDKCLTPAEQFTLMLERAEYVNLIDEGDAAVNEFNDISTYSKYYKL